MKRLIHCLVILALVLAAASPACQFISGKTMEICTADGLKLVSAPADGDSSQHTKKNDCGFCFAQSHIGKIFNDSGSMVLLLLAAALLIVRDARHFRHRRFSNFAARGPPLLI